MKAFLIILGLTIIVSVLLDSLSAWYRPLRFKKWLAKALKDIKDGKPHNPRLLENAKNGIITVRDNRITVKTRHLDELHVEWDKVDKILCYKLDLGMYDSACIGFSYADDQPWIEVNEDMSGFVDLSIEIEKKVPGFDHQYYHWLFRTRAFDTTPFVIWDRKFGLINYPGGKINTANQ